MEDISHLLNSSKQPLKYARCDAPLFTRSLFSVWHHSPHCMGLATSCLFNNISVIRCQPFLDVALHKVKIDIMLQTFWYPLRSPTWPYAKIELLKPAKQFSTIGSPTIPKTACCPYVNSTNLEFNVLLQYSQYFRSFFKVL